MDIFRLLTKLLGLGRSLILIILPILILPLMLMEIDVAQAQGPTGSETNSKLELQVLEIIRKNPQVILESVQAYQKSQRDKQSQAQEQTLKQIRAKPQAFIQTSPRKGANDQKLILMEFSDFQCPYCAQAHDTVQQFMASQNRTTLVYKHFPLVNIHAEAEPAALASWAAQQQNKFWEYHDGLFKAQKNLGEPLFITLATGLKLDLKKFNSDRQSETAKQAIKKDVELGMAIGVPGTPFFLLNGVPIKVSDNLRADLESAIKS